MVAFALRQLGAPYRYAGTSPATGFDCSGFVQYVYGRFGVAVPHARLRDLDRMRGVFIRLETPVEFGAVDDQPVDLVFALLAPAHSRSEHLRALARVSRVLRQADLREQLRQARSTDAVYALLAREARPSAA